MATTGVNVAELGGQAGSVCEIGERLDVARRDWCHALTGTAAAFTLEDATAALRDVRDVWQDEFRVYHEVLRHWCDAAHAAAAGYESVDEYLADRIAR